MYSFNWCPIQTVVAILIAVAPSSRSQAVEFVENLVDDNSRGNARLLSVDLDGDGTLEILGAVIEANAITYWKSSGEGPLEWTRHVVAEGFVGARSVFAEDLDGDHDLDVIGAAYDGGEVAWWRNDGGSPISWRKFPIDSSYSFPHEVYAADIDSDGDNDVLCASSSLNRITVWRNDGGQSPSWTEFTVAVGFGMAKSVTAADLDGDGRMDIIGAALQSNWVRWWKNTGDDPDQWQGHSIDERFQGAHWVQTVDLDRDGDLDVLGAGYTGHDVAWWRNDGGMPIAWVRHDISNAVPNACVAHGVDVDSDGDVDVLASAQATGEVLWFRNDGGDPITWTRSRIGTLPRVWPLTTGDLDGDGDHDVIAGSSHRGSREVVWFRTDGARRGVRFPVIRVRPDE